MENETRELLEQILANQVVIFKRLEEIEYKIKGGGRSAPAKSYVRDLHKEAEKFLPFINQED